MHRVIKPAWIMMDVLSAGIVVALMRSIARHVSGILTQSLLSGALVIGYVALMLWVRCTAEGLIGATRAGDVRRRTHHTTGTINKWTERKTEQIALEREKETHNANIP